ncbi:HET-domain-containing protein [Annulohypoxylon truncatum]|uniref:HET-domain-containing protein n=1 Tax=Annulohypoxylon truncatum TaxID=327061 RepID=UPI002007C1C9|nr:HET-domain-containing protein [Annulohypoxylon truncatum]KAI1214496.1 HET-domain-containing protein [Annulohypoxylon truncatum]
MTTTIPPLANLCERCRVLEFDDSAWPGAHQAGSEAEGYYLEGPIDLYKPSTWSLKLDYSMRDSLPDLPRLEHTAKDGCGFCAVLKKSIQKYAKACFDEVLVSLGYQWYPYNKMSWMGGPIGLKSLIAQLQWVVRIDNNGDHPNTSTLLHFGVDSPSSPCAQWLRLESSPRDETLSPENLDMILNNIKNNDCVRTTTESTSTYPTRLIDIGDDESTSCRLVETSLDATFVQSPNIPYAALSYCWGSPEDSTRQFKTKKDSLDERLNGFELSEVSPILRDAIIATRALRIQYLWVDAVCIIQHDSKDWEKESSRMSVVFQNATVTICTPVSTSCQQGFLTRDWIMTSIKFQSKINTTLSGSYIVRLLGEIDEEYHAAYECFNFSALFSNWARRGWVLQEIELSQRLVIFGRTKVHVVTEKGTHSETNEAVKILYSSREARFYQRGRNHWEKYRYWARLVERYSTRNLAYRSDKLPAISGLAIPLLDGSSNRYFAGHTILHVDLFWFMDHLSGSYGPDLTMDQMINSLYNQQQYIAPSWSWASRVSRIVFSDERFGLISDKEPSGIKNECGINCEISLSGLNPYGAVDGGSLTINGVVVPLVLRVEHPSRILLESANKNGGYIADMRFDWNLFENIGSFEGLSLVLIGSKKVEEDFIWDDTRIIILVGQGGNIYGPKDNWIVGGIQGHKRVNFLDDKLVHGILPMAEKLSDRASSSSEPDRNTHLGEDEERCAYGIIVHPAPEPGKFLRVGAFFSVPRECGGLGYFRSHPTRTIEII